MSVAWWVLLGWCFIAQYHVSSLFKLWILNFRIWNLFGCSPVPFSWNIITYSSSLQDPSSSAFRSVLELTGSFYWKSNFSNPGWRSLETSLQCRHSFINCFYHWFNTKHLGVPASSNKSRSKFYLKNLKNSNSSHLVSRDRLLEISQRPSLLKCAARQTHRRVFKGPLITTF